MSFGNRLTAYDGGLEPSSNEQFLKDWFSPEKLKYLNRSNTRDHFMALMNMLEICIPGKPKVSFDRKKDIMLFQFQNGDALLTFEYLSDGQKAMIAMVADLGIRCLILNAGIFGDESIIKSSGVVLIDEIDLHIHPKWQKEIIQNLRRAIPRIQFIITTHSPFVIQALEAGELVEWEQDRKFGMYVNQSLEDIAENVQDVANPQWSLKRQEMFDTAKDIFREMNKATNLSKLEKTRMRSHFLKSIKPFSDNLAYCAYIELKLFENGFSES